MNDNQESATNNLNVSSSSSQLTTMKDNQEIATNSLNASSSSSQPTTMKDNQESATNNLDISSSNTDDTLFTVGNNQQTASNSLHYSSSSNNQQITANDEDETSISDVVSGLLSISEDLANIPNNSQDMTATNNELTPSILLMPNNTLANLLTDESQSVTSNECQPSTSCETNESQSVTSSETVECHQSTNFTETNECQQKISSNSDVAVKDTSNNKMLNDNIETIVLVDENVESKLGKDLLKEKKSNKNRYVSWAWPYVFIMIGFVTFYLIQVNYDSLPTPKTEMEIEKYPIMFSGHRSAAILKDITALGERVAGSVVNEVKTPNLLMNIIQDIQLNQHPVQSIKAEIQVGSGAFNLKNSNQFTHIYQGMKNVVAKLDGNGGNYTMLMNCHYDSVPSSVGASDDATSCAVMLEILRALSSSRQRLWNDVIFLFNGAEEPFLSGSHLFLQHPWSEKVFAFLNMEGMGGGGRPLLFQVSPHTEWLFNYYAANAPYPHAQVFADEIFVSGIIPSDTDYTIFKDFKNIAGLDFAFVRNGYIHHSKYDTEDYISFASHQVYGDNILATVKDFSNSIRPKNKDLYDTMVFYDYLGWFMIYYTQYTSTFINFLTAIGVFVSVNLFAYISRTFKEIFFSTLANVCGIGLGIGLSCLVSVFMNEVSHFSMTFYHNQFLIFPLYWIPCIVGACIPPYLMDLWRMKKNGHHVTRQAQLNVVSYQIPWTIILCVLTGMGIRSSHIIFISLLFTCATTFVTHLLKPLYETRFIWVWLYLVMNILSILYLMYLSLLLYIILVPMFSRTGPVNADLIIALVSAFLTLLVTSSILPLLTLVRGRFWFLCVLILTTMISIILATLSPLGMPYQSGATHPTPQRFFLMHVERNYYKLDSTLRKNVIGYVLLNTDRNTVRTLPEHITLNMTTLEENVGDEMHHSFITRLSTYGTSSNWIPAPLGSPAPQLTEKLSLSAKNRPCVNETYCTITLEFRGADRMAMFLTPKPGVDLYSWSIPAQLVPHGSWEGRPTYFVIILMGELDTYTMDIGLTVRDSGAPVMDVGLAGYATHHPELRSEEFQTLIADLPEYSTVTAWNCIYNQYVL